MRKRRFDIMASFARARGGQGDIGQIIHGQVDLTVAAVGEQAAISTPLGSLGLPPRTRGRGQLSSCHFVQLKARLNAASTTAAASLSWDFVWVR
jgi:hypothetical protein